MNGLRLIAVAAISRNGIIGVNNRLPWRCTEEMQQFQRITCANFEPNFKFPIAKPIIIMGRLTFESLQCRPLKNRINIVISTKLSQVAAAAASTNMGQYYCVPTIDAALETIRQLNHRHAYIIGGYGIYYEFLVQRKLCTDILLSHMNFDIDIQPNNSCTYNIL